MGALNNDFVSSVVAMTALDRDGICAAQVRTGAGVLVLNGDLVSGGVATLGHQQRIGLYSSADLRALTFTVTGTDKKGLAISEAITGPNNTTVSTTANFYTVTGVSVSGTIGTNVEVGTTNAGESSWMALDRGRPLKGISVELSSGASLTYEVQYAAWELDGAAETSVLAIADATLTAKTTSAGLATTMIWPHIRLKVTSFTSGTATLKVLQA